MLTTSLCRSIKTLAVAAPLLLASSLVRSAGAAQTPPPAPPPEAGAPQTPPAPPPPPESTGGPAEAPPTTSGSGGRQLLLPDISLNGILLGHLSDDKRDQERDKLRLDQIEIAIQGFVYPGIKLDTFAVFAEGEAIIEEAYLSVLNIGLAKLPISAQVGRRKVPFGRVNQLHPHSWLYVVQPYVLSNLVSGESLTGDGATLSYLLPTGKLFAQLDAGFWSLSESPEDFEAAQDPSQGIATSPGVGFADKFYTLRLLTAAPALGGDVELAGSLAQGRGLSYSLGDEMSVRPNILLSGLSLTYRRAGSGAARLLVRGEYVRHRQTDGAFKQTTDGYYLFADQRLDDYTSLGARYDWSEFPFAPGLHESAVSLIGTRQLTEATYLRAQVIHGKRPGQRSFNEVWFQWVFGVGPHTHNLE